MKIDTEKWGKFRLIDLFDLELSKDDLQPKNLTTGNIPLVSSGKINNGIVAYIEKVNAKLWEAGTITVDMFGKVFYQNKPYYCVSHGRVNVLLPKLHLSKLSLLFVARVIENITIKYSFNEMCNNGQLKQLVLYLPVDKQGNPDWKYMEDYMKDIEAKVKSALQGLKLANVGKSKLIDVTQWKEFEIKDLFGKLDLKILKTDFNKKTDVSIEHNQEFNLPLVNAKHFNNGIMFYGREKDFESAEMTLDIVKNGAIATGDVYAQPQKTGVLWDAYLVKPLWNCRSAYVLHYMACVIERCIKSHFSWNDKCVWDRVKQEKIKLPVDKQGNPDWKYMEDYMRQVEKRVQNNLQYLRSAV